MNTVSLTGRLTRDPEQMQKSNGDGSYSYFTIAVDAGKDKNGQKLTEFIDCIAYNNQANFLANYAKKGFLIEVNGRLHTSIKEDSEGNKTKRVTVVAFNVGILASVNAPANKPETAPAPATPIETANESITSDALPFEI